MPEAGWVGRIETLIRQLQGMLGGKAVRSGTVDVTWPGGSPTSNSVAVPHGLAGAPTAVVATLRDGGGAQYSSVAAFSYGATTFNVQIHTDDGSSPAGSVTSVVAWAAFG